jgi:hypothetical protein
MLECCKHLFTSSKHKRAPFHAGYTRTGLPQSEQPGLLRGSECMVRFTREVPIPPLVRATRAHMQRTPTAVVRAKTHHSAKGHPTGSCLLQKLRCGRAVEDPDNLIGAAPRASSGSVHSLPLMINEPESLKSKDPGNRWCEVRAGIQRWVADAGRFRLRP